MEWIEGALMAPWTITILAVIAALVAGRLIVRVARPGLVRLAGRTSTEWDDRLIEALSAPLSWVLALQALRLAMPWLPLEPRARVTLGDAIAITTTLGVLWTAFRAIDLAHAVMERRSWAIARPASRSLLSIGARFAKVTVLVIGGIVGLAQLGVSVASLIAGLGIGGLAFALAAQKTLENLFGTLSIGVDQPMREGDVVKVFDVTGTVEQIGLRSTRIRTVDRTIVTIPNGDLANQRIESFSVRDRLRLAATIGLVYQTTAAQLTAILAELEAILRRQPKLWPDELVVRLRGLGAAALEIEITAWFSTVDWTEFLAIRQEVWLAFLAAIEQHGSAIAYPTQTLHVGRTAPAPPPGPGAA
jgi:MscS family membrane protein